MMKSELLNDLQRYFNGIANPTADELRLKAALDTELTGKNTLPTSYIRRARRILVEKIISGDVIPVIGNSAVTIKGETSSNYLLNGVTNEYYPRLSNGQTVSFDLLMMQEKMSEMVYENTADYIEDNQETFIPSDALRELLAIKHFPFVLTTVVDPTVENAMRAIHGNKLRVLAFSNDAAKNEDIESSLDTTRPTLYYMFGKANNDGKKFVLTETDLLHFSRSWLLKKDSNDRSKPSNLANALAGKFLLVIGNDFQDWLFRFFWLGMKDDKLMDSNMENGMNATKEIDMWQEDFMAASKIYRSWVKDLPTFVTDLKTELAKAEPQSDNDAWFSRPQQHADVFISYSRADSGVAETLYAQLKEQGLNVWFDKNNLGLGDEFKREIRNAIRTCKIFIPVFSDNITRQAHEEHIYRLEWDWAIEHRKQVSRAAYRIVPLAEENFDFYNDLADVPDTLQTEDIIKSHNAGLFKRNDMQADLASFAEGVAGLRRNIIDNNNNF